MKRSLSETRLERLSLRRKFERPCEIFFRKTLQNKSHPSVQNHGILAKIHGKFLASPAKQDLAMILP